MKKKKMKKKEKKNCWKIRDGERIQTSRKTKARPTTTKASY